MHNAAKPSMHGGIINPLYCILKRLMDIIKKGVRLMTVQQKIFALIIGAGVFLIIWRWSRRRFVKSIRFLWLATGFGILCDLW